MAHKGSSGMCATMFYLDSFCRRKSLDNWAKRDRWQHLLLIILSLQTASQCQGVSETVDFWFILRNSAVVGETSAVIS